MIVYNPKDYESMGFKRNKVMEVARLIKEHREVLGFTQRELCKKLGFSEQFLGRIEKGSAPLPLPYAKKFMKALKIENKVLEAAFTIDYQLKIYKFIY